MKLIGFVAVQQVTHGAIQFTTYEELRKFAINYRTDGSEINSITADTSLVNLQKPMLILCHRNIYLVYSFSHIRAHSFVKFVWSSVMSDLVL